MKRTTTVASVGEVYSLPRKGGKAPPVAVEVLSVTAEGDTECRYIKPAQRAGEGIYLSSQYLIEQCWKASTDYARDLKVGWA